MDKLRIIIPIPGHKNKKISIIPVIIKTIPKIPFRSNPKIKAVNPIRPAIVNPMIKSLTYHPYCGFSSFILNTLEKLLLLFVTKCRDYINVIVSRPIVTTLLYPFVYIYINERR